MSWQELIAGARMQVDQEFSERITESEFSRQQWGLIMTAVEFDVTEAQNPDSARIVADTSKVEHVLPELDNLDQAMGAMGAGGSGGGANRGGVLSGLKDLVGLGGGSGGGDAERKAAAEALAQEYATELQTHLETNGRWEQVREAAATE